LFSGQSNVDLPVTYVHQFTPSEEEAEERIAEEMGRSGMLRLMIVPARCGIMYHDDIIPKELSDVPECNACPPAFGPQTPGFANVCNQLGGHANNYSYCNCDSLSWVRASAANVRGFSAIAWFTGRAIVESGIAKGVPLGLVRSSWGATNIVAWCGPEAVSSCPQEGEPPTSFAPYRRSSLYAHMIMPLKGLQFSAVIWFHGARNVGGPTPYMGGRYYGCALQAMIKEWRTSLEQLTLPFLVVESPVYCNELDFRTWHSWCSDRTSRLKRPDEHLPEMRLAQNQAEQLPHVYLVSAMDQGNLEKALGGSIHSVAKRDLGIRVSLAARTAVYGDEEVVWSGPRPRVAWKNDPSHVSICFDTGRGGGLVLNESTRCPEAVLPVYCTGATFELEINGSWRTPVTSIICGTSVVLELAGHDALRVTRVRYAWADWPVNSLYSEAGLPARLFNMPVGDDPGVAVNNCPGGSLDVMGIAVAPGAVCAGSDSRSHTSTDATDAASDEAPPIAAASIPSVDHRGKKEDPEHASSSLMKSRGSSSISNSSSSRTSGSPGRLGRPTGPVERPAAGGSRTALTVSLVVSLAVVLPLFWVMSASIVSCFKRDEREHCPLPGRDPFQDDSSTLNSPSSASTGSKYTVTPDGAIDQAGDKRLMVLAAVPIVSKNRGWDRRRPEEAPLVDTNHRLGRGGKRTITAM